MATTDHDTEKRPTDGDPVDPQQPDFARELKALMTQSFSAAASSFARAETENISMMRRSAHIRDADRAARLSVYLDNALAARSQRLARGPG